MQLTEGEDMWISHLNSCCSCLEFSANQSLNHRSECYLLSQNLIVYCTEPLWVLIIKISVQFSYIFSPRLLQSNLLGWFLNEEIYAGRYLRLDPLTDKAFLLKGTLLIQVTVLPSFSSVKSLLIGLCLNKWFTNYVSIEAFLYQVTTSVLTPFICIHVLFCSSVNNTIVKIKL